MGPRVNWRPALLWSLQQVLDTCGTVYGVWIKARAAVQSGMAKSFDDSPPQYSWGFRQAAWPSQTALQLAAADLTGQDCEPSGALPYACPGRWDFWAGIRLASGRFNPQPLCQSATFNSAAVERVLISLPRLSGHSHSISDPGWCSTSTQEKWNVLLCLGVMAPSWKGPLCRLLCHWRQLREAAVKAASSAATWQEATNVEQNRDRPGIMP